MSDPDYSLKIVLLTEHIVMIPHVHTRLTALADLTAVGVVMIMSMAVPVISMRRCVRL